MFNEASLLSWEVHWSLRAVLVFLPVVVHDFWVEKVSVDGLEGGSRVVVPGSDLNRQAVPLALHPLQCARLLQRSHLLWDPRVLWGSLYLR